MKQCKWLFFVFFISLFCNRVKQNTFPISVTQVTGNVSKQIKRSASRLRSGQSLPGNVIVISEKDSSAYLQLPLVKVKLLESSQLRVMTLSDNNFILYLDEGSMFIRFDKNLKEKKFISIQTANLKSQLKYGQYKFTASKKKGREGMFIRYGNAQVVIQENKTVNLKEGEVLFVNTRSGRYKKRRTNKKEISALKSLDKV